MSYDSEVSQKIINLIDTLKLEWGLNRSSSPADLNEGQAEILNNLTDALELYEETV